ncbi:MAG: DMT family transporter [Lachnospiraceae bacterium]|nr:DMT family transporter [Lachnospiraceae bacterium]
MGYRRNPIFNIIMLLLCAMIWGFAFSAQSVGAEYVGPWTFLAARAWIGVATLLVFIGVRSFIILRTDEGRRAYEDAEASLSRRGEDCAYGKIAMFRGRLKIGKTMLIAGASTGILLCLASVTQQAAIAYTTVAKSSFITAMYVVIVPILSLLLGRRSGARIWFAVALSVVGLYMLSFSDGIGSVNKGDLMTLGCAVLFAMQIICVNHFVDRLDGLVLSCSEFFFEAVLATCGMLIFEEPSISSLVPAFTAILYAGVMSNGVAYTLQILGQKGFDPTVASLCMCMESVFGALGGFILLKQTLTVRELMGCVLMFGAILMAELPSRRRRQSE